MRSLLVTLVPAVLLSLSVVACSADSTDVEPEPAPHHTTSPLVAEGGECDASNDCEEGLSCNLPDVSTNSLHIKGMPAPSPSPAPTTAPTPAPTPAPSPTPARHKICTKG